MPGGGGEGRARGRREDARVEKGKSHRGDSRLEDLGVVAPPRSRSRNAQACATKINLGEGEEPRREGTEMKERGTTRGRREPVQPRNLRLSLSLSLFRVLLVSHFLLDSLSPALVYS